MNPAARQILNKLKCPICKSPIDLMSYTAQPNRKGYNFGCAQEPDHYAIWFVHWDRKNSLEKESVHVYDEKHKYNIVKDHLPTLIQTQIYVHDIDPERRIIPSHKETKLIIEQDVFDFNEFDSEKAINRIKMIFIFQ